MASKRISIAFFKDYEPMYADYTIPDLEGSLEWACWSKDSDFVSRYAREQPSEEARKQLIGIAVHARNVEAMKMFHEEGVDFTKSVDISLVRSKRWELGEYISRDKQRIEHVQLPNIVMSTVCLFNAIVYQNTEMFRFLLESYAFDAVTLQHALRYADEVRSQPMKEAICQKLISSVSAE